MLTLALYGLLALLLAGALFLGAAYLLPAGEQIAPPIRDEPIWDLPPEKRLEFADVTSVRLPVALRGYRFQETDLLLDRLAEELRDRDAEISRLRARTGVEEVYQAPNEYAFSNFGLDDEQEHVWRRPADDVDEPTAGDNGTVSPIRPEVDVEADEEPGDESRRR